MCDKFTGKFGFTPVDDECVTMCCQNPLIVPKLVRYQGMGYYQILATAKDHPHKFFLIPAGGSNGYEVESNHQDLNKLTLKEALSLKEVTKQIEQESWTEITDTQSFTGGGEIHTVVTHHN